MRTNRIIKKEGRKKVAEDKCVPIDNSVDKMGFIAGTLVVVLMPQYWLVKKPLLLALFWIICLPILATFPLYYCKKCRHTLCPFNCVKLNEEPIPQ
jgi:hypothetical protein